MSDINFDRDSFRHSDEMKIYVLGEVMLEYMETHWAGCRTDDENMCITCRDWLKFKEALKDAVKADEK